MNKKKLTLIETFTLAFENHKKNNLKKAENLYKKVLKMNPNHFESILYLGTLLGQTNKLALAKPFPNDEKNISLDNWNKFELNNQDVFANMYQFWVRKAQKI